MIYDIKKIGKKGESLAAKYLNKNGYIIRNRNWRYGRLEIDLIASWGGKLVFFEIKTRIGGYLHPEENLKIKQIKNLKKAIFFYCSYYSINIEKTQLDFIFISLNRRAKVDRAFHFKNITD